MGDMSGEPSMEDILASIKRVIKEGDTPAPRRAAPLPRAEEQAASDAILELNEPLSPAPPPPSPTPAPILSAEAFEERLAAAIAPPPPPPVAAPVEAPEDRRPPTPIMPPPAIDVDDANETPVVSPATVEAARGALGALSRLVVKPEPESDGTLEGLVRDMLRPMLSEWLDQNLPRLVEQMVAREIAKITSAKG